MTTIILVVSCPDEDVPQMKRWLTVVPDAVSPEARIDIAPAELPTRDIWRINEILSQGGAFVGVEGEMCSPT